VVPNELPVPSDAIMDASAAEPEAPATRAEDIRGFDEAVPLPAVRVSGAIAVRLTKKVPEVPRREPPERWVYVTLKRARIVATGRRAMLLTVSASATKARFLLEAAAPDGQFKLPSRVLLGPFKVTRDVVRLVRAGRTRF
jgi:hypothetical protein